MTPNFENENGLIPAIIQDASTEKVLMLGYMNEEAFIKTQKTQLVTFFSRSKQRLWTKGEVSGNTLKVKSITLDCDKDTILIKVSPNGPTCHTGADTCWNEKNTKDFGFLTQLETIISNRQKNPELKNSYIATLFSKGINKIAQKLGEEAIETVIEAKDSNNDLFLNECADLLFHYLILLQAKGNKLSDVIKILQTRHR